MNAETMPGAGPVDEPVGLVAKLRDWADDAYELQAGEFAQVRADMTAAAEEIERAWAARDAAAAAERARWIELVGQLVACHEDKSCPAVEWAIDMLKGQYET